MPSDSNIFAIRIRNESKGFQLSTTQNQDPNSGKRPQNIYKFMPTSTTQKLTSNVIGLIRIMRNPTNQLAT
jgi:hypothetical protein